MIELPRTSASSGPGQFSTIGASAKTRRFWMALAIFLLFMLTNPLEFVIKGIVPGAQALSDPTTTRAIYPNVMLQLMVKAGLLAGFLFLAAPGWRLVPAVLRRAPLPFAFLVYAIASRSWSDTPGSTTTDIIYLATALTAGTALAIRFEAEELARVIGHAGVVIAFVSIIMIALFPTYGVHSPAEAAQGDLAGAWRGVYLQKNMLGQVMATFFAIYLLKGRELLGSRARQATALAVMLALVVGTRSASAFALLVLCAGGSIILFVLSRFTQIIIVLLAPILLLIIGALSSAVLSALGRGTDMSGRAFIWQAAGRMIAERPLFGYGYGSALMGGFTPYIISRFKAQNAHNGYIDLALSTGIIGSLLLYGAIAVAMVRAVQSRNTGGPNMLLATTLGTFVIGWLIAAFSEVMLRPNMPMGSLGIASLVILSCLGLDRRDAGSR